MWDKSQVPGAMKGPCVFQTFLCHLFLNRFDRTLGGLEMELRLREHLAKLFNEQRKGQRAKDVRENPRAMAKLLREANRLKTVLSANADHMAQVPARGCLRENIPHAEGRGPHPPELGRWRAVWPIPSSSASCRSPKVLVPPGVCPAWPEEDPGGNPDMLHPPPDRGPDG